MKIKKYLYILILLFTICIVSVIIINKAKEKSMNKFEASTTEENEIQYQENVSVDEIKNEIGYKADSNLYSVDTEYDGRKVLNIKLDLQYKVAFAGIIKQQNLNMAEIDTIFSENYPAQNGVWIEKTNREKIIEMINENTKSIYKINDEGYLNIEEKKEQNNYDIILEKLIASDKKIILTINSYYYEIDNVTGEIVEYPFEKLDNYQPFDMIKSGDNVLVVLSSNKDKKLTKNQILEEMLLNLKESIL